MKSIVFFDSQVSNYQTLAQNLKGETQGVILDPTQDGIEQISRYLESHQTESVHIISHGAPGTLYLGNGSLNLTNLNDYASTLSNWKVSQIFLYGCHVAKGDAGAEFIDKLHRITQASIAATQTLTGNKELGGNWDLAVTRGQITSGLVIAEAARNAYAGVLATYTVNTIFDENDGINTGNISLRDAISAANANAGADTILFNPAINNAVIGLSNGLLQVSDDLTIRGNGNGTRISGRNISTVFYIDDRSSNKNTNVTIEGLQIIDGNDSSGGGIDNRENLRLINTTISNNTARFDGGGGFRNYRTATVINSTFNNNTSDYGAAIYNDGILNIINTTISNNSSTLYGGGIYNDGQANIFNSTITRNSAANGGSGIVTSTNSGRLTQLSNTIVSGNNGTDIDSRGTNIIYSLGGNLIGTGNAIGSFNEPKDQTGVLNPQLGALANNGGPTLTHKANNNSPAINAGFELSIPSDSLDIDGDGNTSERLPLDQTGNIRVQQSSVDIGAGETNYGGIAITLAVNPVSVNEDGTTNLIYTFTRTGNLTNPLTVNYTIAGTATNGIDYTNIGTSVTFAANAATATLTIDPTADTTIESDETVALTLASGTEYTIETTTAVTGTILNDDAAPSTTLSINDITVIEGKDARAILTVSLSSPSSQPISVNYTTNPINATANTDYTTQTGTLNISANSSTGTIFIPLLNDNLNEADEAFTITLSGPVNATLSNDSVGEVTISDTWQSNLTRILPGGVENLRLIGNNPINGTGNEGNNVLTGNSANNTLAGLGGNDTYIFAANGPLGQDIISETTTGGSDTLDFSGTNAPIRLNLASITNQTAVTGNLTLKLSANNVIENTSGGNGHDRINGNTLNNSLSGNGGKDTLNGGAGLDYLSGNPGDDLLIGGTGNDSFAYNTGKVFIPSDIGLDTLTDFTPAADKLILSKTTFSALTSIVGNGFSQSTDFAIVEDDVFVETSAAFIVYSSSSGSLFYNQNGSAIGLGTGAEFAFLANSPTLTRSDFTLVL